MKNLCGITGIRVKTFVVEPNDNFELNTFLEEYDGKIIDISVAGMTLGLCTFVVTYKVVE